jgi:heme/copper-type cytochrome/quinol oxidase subunit 2
LKEASTYRASTYWMYYATLEFIWTIVPCFILILISLPSFTLALALDEAHKPAIWLKIIGNQWFWVYEYSTFKENVVIYSNLLDATGLKHMSLRLLTPDNVITMPVNRFTRLLVTSSDVIHSWAVPALGVKIDACPGRINTIGVLPTRTGIYYGQCSEICGINHAFMPIAVQVVA